MSPRVASIISFPYFRNKNKHWELAEVIMGKASASFIFFHSTIDSVDTWPLIESKNLSMGEGWGRLGGLPIVIYHNHFLSHEAEVLENSYISWEALFLDADGFSTLTEFPWILMMGEAASGTPGISLSLTRSGTLADFLMKDGMENDISAKSKQKTYDKRYARGY